MGSSVVAYGQERIAVTTSRCALSPGDTKRTRRSRASSREDAKASAGGPEVDCELSRYCRRRVKPAYFSVERLGWWRVSP